jgi:hypothetical protein
MATSTSNSRQRFLCVAFFIFEALSIVSFIVLGGFEHLLYRHESVRFGGTVPAVLIISLSVLSIMCVFLRRTHSRLAFIGWITALVLFLYVMFVPVIS